MQYFPLFKEYLKKWVNRTFDSQVIIDQRIAHSHILTYLSVAGPIYTISCRNDFFKLFRLDNEGHHVLTRSVQLSLLKSDKR